MFKSNRKVGEQELNVNSSRVLVQNWLTSLVPLSLFIDEIVVTVGRSPAFYDAKLSGHKYRISGVLLLLNSRDIVDNRS